MFFIGDLPPTAPVPDQPHRDPHNHHATALTNRSSFMYLSPIRGPRLLATFKQQIDSGHISVVLDAVEQDWHIDAAPDHNRVVLRRVLEKLSRWGYEPIPAEECEEELLENGAVRVYLYAERGAIIG